jgi:PH domain
MSRGNSRGNSPTCELDVDSIPILTGYMVKRGRFFPSWNRRYFELFISRLEYYTDDHKTVMKGCYKLHPNVLCSDDSIRHFCFRLHEAGDDKRADIFYLTASNMEEKEDWKGKINYAIL